jgi:RimJ/RimL family protein N-acetyltransferase
MDVPVLRTTRCVVRGLRAADVPELARYRSDPRVARYQSWDGYTEQDARALLDKLAATPLGTTGTWYQLAIARAGDDVLIGDIGLHFLDEQQVELGFTLGFENHGAGLAREAVGAVVDHLFVAWGRHRLVATTDARNARAARLLEALGFRREAHHIDNVLFKGAWGSEYVYALLRREHGFERDDIARQSAPPDR